MIHRKNIRLTSTRDLMTEWQKVQRAIACLLNAGLNMPVQLCRYAECIRVELCVRDEDNGLIKQMSNIVDAARRFAEENVVLTGDNV